MMPLWEPVFRSEGFSVRLSGDFAEEAYALNSPEYQEKMNELGAELLEDEDVYWERPYRFRDDSMLVTSIHLGNNGTWISTTDSPEDDFLTYYSHNVDTDSEIVVLQRLFGDWARKTEALLESEN